MKENICVTTRPTDFVAFRPIVNIRIEPLQVTSSAAMLVVPMIIIYQEKILFTSR